MLQQRSAAVRAKVFPIRAPLCARVAAVRNILSFLSSSSRNFYAFRFRPLGCSSQQAMGDETTILRQYSEETLGTELPRWVVAAC